MEKRVLFAIILSLAVLLLWQALFPPPKPKRAERALPQQTEEKKPLQEDVFSKAMSEKETEVSPRPASPAKPEHTPLASEKEIVVNTDLYTATFSSRGASLKSLELLRYRNKMDPPNICFVFPFSLLYGKKMPNHNSQLKKLVNTQGLVNNPFQTVFNGPDLDYHVFAPFTANKSFLELDSTNPRGEITFSRLSEDGVAFSKKFAFFNDGYYVDYDFTIENNSSKPLEGSSVVEWTSAVKSDGQEKTGGFFGGIGGEIQQFIYLISDKVNRKELKDIEENKAFSGEIKWAGFEEKYFVSSLIPRNAQDLKLKLFKSKDSEITFQVVSPLTDIPRNAKQSFPYSIYLGPKDLNCLEREGGELGRVVSFGFFDPVAKPMLFLLKLFYKFIPNYGLAIIFLSIGIKLVFWPLTHKSQKSMKGMQKLQPKIAELKEKYKNNKEELNRKTMEFYRTNKVNPLGGCLPILIQIPVFFALYRVLLNSIEIRHAPLMSFWINDLSSKDPTYISPLLMGASMFIQQKMTPTVGDPAQAKIMLAMPVIFTFMFLSFPSGLVIYWLVTNVLSIAQQYYINKHST